MVNKKIFICTAAFNEDDLVQTIDSCLSTAEYPDNISFGLALQYPDTPYPDLSKFKNVRYVKMDDPFPYGTSPSRNIAASLRQDEHYFLSIDAHMIFKPKWDSYLFYYYDLLSHSYEKPVITTYTPYWWRDHETGAVTNQLGSTDLNTDMTTMLLRFKNENDIKTGLYQIPSPTWHRSVVRPYEEHHLASAHFLFAKSSFLDDVPFDPLLTYYEENTLALRAWTRGYRMFSIEKDVLWTREMFAGRDVPNSWRANSIRKNKNNEVYQERVMQGANRCKEILTGGILGLYGSPSEELRLMYEEAAGINYETEYSKINIYG
jgi:hypothetical protein